MDDGMGRDVSALLYALRWAPSFGRSLLSYLFALSCPPPAGHRRDGSRTCGERVQSVLRDRRGHQLVCGQYVTPFMGSRPVPLHVGRSPSPSTSFTGPLPSPWDNPYIQVGKHRHMPEVEQGLSEASGKDVHVSFTPHLINMSRYGVVNMGSK